MARRRRYPPLKVLLNDRELGRFGKEAGGSVHFTYDENWLGWENAIPVSLSLPVRERRYAGASVAAVFENLLPDVDQVRRRLAERVGAAGTDAYSLLAEIGRDCVGALQFLPEEQEPTPTTQIDASPISNDDIGKLIANLGRVPLGVSSDSGRDFRISVAGAQQKTALLHHNNRWMLPHGTTPTTHLIKPQIGQLPDGPDLSDSVENEYYALKLMQAFGVPVNQVEMKQFSGHKVLVVERFDRRWTLDGRLVRLPQEDCCQALSVSPTQKYQPQGGPGIVDIMELLLGSDNPTDDRERFFTIQVLFWLLGVTDGHAKNFSVFLRPQNSFTLTPLYDVLTLQPFYDNKQLQRQFFKLSMSVGDRAQYQIPFISGDHFVATGRRAGLSKERATALIAGVREQSICALQTVENELPEDFPAYIHDSVKQAFINRLRQLELG